MAFFNNYPQYYQPNYQPQYTPQVPASQPHMQTNNLIWCQGENAAKSYPVSAGQSVLLMDSENPVMYIKSTDQSGMPLPLRIFDYTERTQERAERVQTVAEPKMDYISRNEFDAFRDEIKAEIKQVNKPITTTAKTAAKEK